ncbi:MAG TPA: hypothetical protein VJ947_01595, partial [Pseudohaliea sp.]|nr:hypothetical protein [Pseudohaliea sp.]
GGPCETLDLPAPPLALAAGSPAGVLHLLSGAGLTRIDGAGGQIRTALTPDTPAARLRSEGGLLYLAGDGPMIAVRRPDPAGYGEQLDALLLLPPGFATGAIRDFARFAGQWWALLEDESGGVELHRFDGAWAHRGAVSLPADLAPARLQPWGQQLLVFEAAAAAAQRVGPDGRVGSPFRSSLLDALQAEQRERQAWQAAGARALRSFLAVALGVALLALLLAADRRRRPGAPPALRLDREQHAFLWFPALVAPRRQRARQTALLAIAALLLGSAGALSGALSPALGAFALGALAAGIAGACAAPAGHLGLRGRRLLLVDHRGVYQGGAADRCHRCGPFLLCGDVALNLGTRTLPTFPRAVAAALSRAGVDERPAARLASLAAVLLRARHPLALGTAAGFLLGLAAVASALR